MKKSDESTKDWQEKRAYIVEIAARMFAAGNYDGISLRKIAEEVGLHMATLYYYFPNKRALYEEVVISSWRRRAQMMAASVAKGTPRDRIARWIRSTTTFLMEDKSARLMDREVIALESGDAVYLGELLIKSQARMAVAALIEEISPPVLKHIPAPRLVEMIHGLIYGVVRYRPVHVVASPGREDLDRASIERDLTTVVFELLYPPGSEPQAPEAPNAPPPGPYSR